MSGRARLLIVEDEAVSAMLFRRELSRAGFEIVGVSSSGEDAVMKARELKPGFVIMDIGLPGKLDGIEAARLLGGSGPRVIFVTGYDDEETRVRAGTVSPLAYFRKPVSFPALIAAMDGAPEA